MKFICNCMSYVYLCRLLHQRWALQAEMKQVMHGLSHLSSSLPGHSQDLTSPIVCSPTRCADPQSSPSRAELHRLRAEVAKLRVRLHWDRTCLLRCRVPSVGCVSDEFDQLGRALYVCKSALPVVREDLFGQLAAKVAASVTWQLGPALSVGNVSSMLPDDRNNSNSRCSSMKALQSRLQWT